MPDIRIVPFGSPLYEDTKRLRFEVLRRPLGLELSARDLLGEDQQIHIAAIDPDKGIVGSVLLKPVTTEVIKLRQMAVSDIAQGRGLGRLLVRFAEKTAAENGFRTVEMHARTTARGFYEKLGYHSEGEEFTEATVSTILMKRVVSNSVLRP